MSGCPHQQSSGGHRLTKILKTAEASPIKKWCKIVIIIKVLTRYSEKKKNGKITLKTATGSSWV